MIELVEKIKTILRLNGLDSLVTEENCQKLAILTDFLLETNKSINLTAIRNEDEAIVKHIADSLTLLPFIKQNATLIDVGCGAGFPSLPIAIVRSDVKVTSLDSTGKKLKFIDDCATKLGLDNITTLNGRAEELASANAPKAMRQKFDVVTARAVAHLPILTELCTPFLKTGGLFLSMKGESAKEEAEKSKNAFEKLHMTLNDIKQINLTNGSDEFVHYVLISKKTSPTPPQYPRKYSVISKKPL